MSKSVSPYSAKAIGLILKPMKKKGNYKFEKYISNIQNGNEQDFLCISSIMLSSPNCMNTAVTYVCNKHILNPSSIPGDLPEEALINFWDLCPIFIHLKAEIAHRLALFNSLLPSSYSEIILTSLIKINDSFLVQNYAQKVPKDSMKKMADFVIENGSNDQIRMFIPFFVSKDNNIIANWIDEFRAGSKVEIALSASLSNCYDLTIESELYDKLCINFFNGNFPIPSDLFESFVFYIQRKIKLINCVSLKLEDRLVKTFSEVANGRPSLVAQIIPVLTEMVNNKIQPPPFTITVFYCGLDDYLYKYAAKTFVSSKDFLGFLPRCYEKSYKNAIARKVLDFSVCALLVRTPPSDPSYRGLLNIILQTAKPRFAHHVYMHVIKLFTNAANRNMALKILEKWQSQKCDTAKVARMILNVFETNNINTIRSIEKVLLKKPNHTIEVLFHFASTAEFVADKGRKALLSTTIEIIVPKLNMNKLRTKKSMPKALADFIKEKVMNEKDEKNEKEKRALPLKEFLIAQITNKVQYKLDINDVFHKIDSLKHKSAHKREKFRRKTELQASQQQQKQNPQQQKQTSKQKHNSQEITATQQQQQQQQPQQQQQQQPQQQQQQQPQQQQPQQQQPQQQQPQQQQPQQQQQQPQQQQPQQQQQQPQQQQQQQQQPPEKQAKPPKPDESKKDSHPPLPPEQKQQPQGITSFLGRFLGAAMRTAPGPTPEVKKDSTPEVKKEPALEMKNEPVQRGYSQPVFTDIEFSDGEIALPDQDYSSSSRDDYSYDDDDLDDAPEIYISNMFEPVDFDLF